MKKIKDTENVEIGLSMEEVRGYSFLKLIRSQVVQDPSLAKFERECSRAVSQRINQQPSGYFVPYDVLKRDMTVGTDSQGGYLVATDLLGANFIDMLRNRMMTVRLGATVLSGLVGDVAIPKQTGGATAYWLSEGGAPTESTP